MNKNNLVELPNKGKLLIITDLHGNLKDYKTYLSIMGNMNGIDHILFTGDFIHGMDEENYDSITILESLRDNCRNIKNFHVLLGNHEWAHIVDGPVFKGNTNQKKDFEIVLKKRFDYNWNQKLEDYKSFFKSLCGYH